MLSLKEALGPIPPKPLNRRPSQSYRVPHPELLDDNGDPVDEPLLVIRSVSVEDARQRLDSIYQSSPRTN